MEKINKNEFGARLRKTMDDRSVTQMQIAEVCGKSRNAVSNWERGENLPELEQFFAVCKLLEISADELLGLRGSESQISGVPPKVIKAAKKLAQLNSDQKSNIINLIETLPAAGQKETQPKFDIERLGRIIEAFDQVGIQLSGKVRAEKIDGLYNNTALKTKNDFVAEIIKLPRR